MTEAVTFELDGVERLARKFDAAGQVAVLRAPMVRSLARLESGLKTYPTQIAPGVWAANTTPRQKRAFFAKLRAGQTSGKRTGTLGRRWTSRTFEQRNTLVGEWGNNTEYARFVQDGEEQARFHRGRWVTTRHVLDNAAAAIEQDFNIAIEQALSE